MAYTSSAVRAAVAAQERGFSLEGVPFRTLGEALTEAKLRALNASGAKVVDEYGFAEATVSHHTVSTHASQTTTTSTPTRWRSSSDPD